MTAQSKVTALTIAARVIESGKSVFTFITGGTVAAAKAAAELIKALS